MKSAAHIIVKGSVQGVGFRYFVYRYAILLNLKGWVRNLGYDQVEIEIEGEKATIEKLVQKLWEGPRFAEVQHVQVTWAEYEGQYSSFDITY
ncbi:acylphosphatase [candidate division KSB1 bacterium]|nr:acylphosphatase [candidate division KSB1 bacterium]